MGPQVTQGLGAGSQPDVGRAAAQEVIDEIRDHLYGRATWCSSPPAWAAAPAPAPPPSIAKTAREMGILTVGVVTKPFHFEGARRMRTAGPGIAELHKVVDTLLIIPNQNLFRVANEKTTFADAFAMADQVLYSGVACITDLMVKEGLINLDFADVRAVMREMGKAMMGTGEATGDKRALTAAEAAIANPLIDDSSMKGARGLLISITGGKDLTLFEVDEAATRIREEVDQDANIIVGATFDETLDGIIRVSVVATGIEQAQIARNRAARCARATATAAAAPDNRLAELTARLRADNARLAERAQKPSRRRQRAGAGRPAARRRTPANNVDARRLPRSPRRSRRNAAQAPIQPASYGDVTVRPIAQKPTLFPDHKDGPPRARSRRRPKPSSRRRPERAPVRAPRMPKFEDLPMPAQAELRQARGERPRRSIRRRPSCRCCSASPMSASAAATKRPSRRSRPAPPVLPWRRCPNASRSAPSPSKWRITTRYRSMHKRPAPQGLDVHGRPAPVAPTPQGDDHLDIPAFLRRQAN